MKGRLTAEAVVMARKLRRVCFDIGSNHKWQTIGRFAKVQRLSITVHFAVGIRETVVAGGLPKLRLSAYSDSRLPSNVPRPRIALAREYHEKMNPPSPDKLQERPPTRDS